MGRDRPSRVNSAPRGLGLYRRAGRDGFFYVKNLAAQAKRHPGRISPAYIDEQIKRSDGANSQYRAGGFGATKYTLNIGGFVCLYSR